MPDIEQSQHVLEKGQQRWVDSSQIQEMARDRGIPQLSEAQHLCVGSVHQYDVFTCNMEHSRTVLSVLKHIGALIRRHTRRCKQNNTSYHVFCTFISRKNLRALRACKSLPPAMKNSASNGIDDTISRSSQERAYFSAILNGERINWCESSK